MAPASSSSGESSGSTRISEHQQVFGKPADTSNDLSRTTSRRSFQQQVNYFVPSSEDRQELQREVSRQNVRPRISLCPTGVDADLSRTVFAILPIFLPPPSSPFLLTDRRYHAHSRPFRR